MQRFGCYGHRINLIVKNALAFPEVGRILVKARKIVTFFHQSSSVSKILKAEQRLLLDEKLVGHKLVIDVVTGGTRHSTCCADFLSDIHVEWLLQMNQVCRSQRQHCVFTFDEHAVVESLVHILDPFKKETTIVCSETTPTIQKVLPMVTELYRAVEMKEDAIPSTCNRKIKENISFEMKNRTKPEPISLLCSALNPFAKDLTFLSQEDRDTALKLLPDILIPLNVTLNVKKRNGY